jgi:hypothetical protein
MTCPSFWLKPCEATHPLLSLEWGVMWLRTLLPPAVWRYSQCGAWELCDNFSWLSWIWYCPRIGSRGLKKCRGVFTNARVAVAALAAVKIMKRCGALQTQPAWWGVVYRGGETAVTHAHQHMKICHQPPASSCWEFSKHIIWPSALFGT